MSTTLWVLADAMRHVATCAAPLMPASADAMLDQLSVPPVHRSFAALAAHPKDAACSPVPGTPVPKPTGLFPRIDLES